MLIDVGGGWYVNPDQICYIRPKQGMETTHATIVFNKGHYSNEIFVNYTSFELAALIDNALEEDLPDDD